MALAVLVINQIDIASEGSSYRGVPSYVLPEIFLFFLALYLTARTGFYRFASIGLLSAYYLGATYTLATWGADLPVGLMVYALLVTLSGVLSGPRFTLVWSTVVIASLAALWHFQHGTSIIQPQLYWKQETTDWGDLVVIAFLFFVIATISWLYGTEISKSLKRARTSERALKRERDNLEITVERRTRDLNQVQMEKMLNLYRFAEFGRRASGFFHDIINPLNVVLLNLEQLQQSEENQDKTDLTDTAASVRRALEGTKRIEQFVQAAQNQVRRESKVSSFEVRKVIEQSAQLLTHSAKQRGIQIAMKWPKEDVTLFGDPLKLNQVVTNLISNAIDAYENCDRQRKEIVINIEKIKSDVALTVQDFGCGISPEHLHRIFEPLFTTKGSSRGIGLGLGIVKDIVEKDFVGTIAVQSTPNTGSKFIITLPSKVE